MFEQAKDHYAAILQEIRDAGLYKHERVIESPQGANIRVGGREVLNFCANNYLGLSSHPQVIAAARASLDERGYGLSSVRFICGTQDKHKQLEAAIATFLATDDTILYSSCFDANGGVFETLLGAEDAIISDELNHASIIDGIRLCKAQRFRYRHDDLDQLESMLREAQSARVRMIATDGVFSMDGDIARLQQICDLAERYGAMVMVDDSHATGFVGKTGRGTPEHHGVMARVDVITSTLGKALGGASGGFITGRKPLIELLRNRSRPYLFSNTLAPPIVAGSLAVLELLSASTELRDRLETNTARFRSGMSAAGFALRPGVHPIVPIMLGEAKLAVDFAARLLEHGIYVIGFSYPVVPKGQARIRVQLSAAHSAADVDRAIAAFSEVGKQLGVL
ncbi:MAG: glycine C-acetyltransferase [Nannocystaceae bacterium]|nr:glycine C-acetyltransferase [Nannocystaceae bacterium]